MGVVWRGRDREIGDLCAVKVLRPEFAVDPAAVTRFVRERTALIRFRHPNVVTLRDMIVEGDRLALVMDLVNGGDLSTYRQNRGGTLPAAEALELTAQICDALAAAHAAGIVHRDLKPANVLLDAGQVKLADFGIARIAGESPATTTGVVIGTIGFLAPEVITGGEPTPACDVYAAGITLYELLTGVQPFTGQPVTVMHGHLDTAPDRPDGMPSRLWALISACLSKDPGARPSATTMASALRDPALLSEPPLPGQASPAGTPYGMSPWAPDGTSSSEAAYVRPSGSARALHSGPVTASARFSAMTASAMPASAMPASAMPASAKPAAAAVARGMVSPETEAAARGASPETEVAAVGMGSAGLPPRPGRRARPRDSRRFGVRPAWAAVAAVALVFAGVAGAYLAMSSSPTGSVTAPVAAAATRTVTAPARTVSHSPSPGATSPSAHPSATTPSAQPSATTPPAQPSATAVVTPVDISSSVPVSSPAATSPGPASATPTSASSYVALEGAVGVEKFTTCVSATHSVNVDPLSFVENGCANRVWLHQNANGSGWSYCVSGHTDESIPAKYDNPAQTLVSANTAAC
jgi:serine/threonine protein kinase, bacterial